MSEPPHVSPSPAENAPAPLLVVDDEQFHRRVIADALEAAGHRAVCVGGVAEAMEAVERLHPPVVLTDLVMPGEGGLELCARLSAMGPRRPYVIIVSAAQDTDQMAAVLDAGADDFVRKPIAPAELLARTRVGLRNQADRRRADMLAEEARLSADRAQSILDTMTEGLILIDPRGRVEGVNPAFERMIGLTRSQVIGLTPPFPWWPPEERSRIMAAFDLARSGRGSFPLTFRRADDARFPVQVSFAALAEDPERPRGHVATVHDLTEQLRTTEALHRARVEQTALRAIAEAVARDQEPARIFEMIAGELASVFGTESGVVAHFHDDRAIVVGTLPTDRYHHVGMELPVDGDGPLARVRLGGVPVSTEYASLPAGDPVRDMAWRDGFVSSIAAPVRVAGRLWGAVLVCTRTGTPLVQERARLGAFADMVGLAVANAEAQARLVEQATTDPLTGLGNRRVFQDRLAEEIARAGRYGRELALLIADLDHFKAINDTHGHLVGDRVLGTFARLLGECARSTDVVARIGGEEFAWIMPDTDAQAGIVAAERLRRACELEDFGVAGRVTCSSGMAGWTPPLDGDDLVRTADHALYEAKRRGRNRVMLAEAPVIRDTVHLAEAAPAP